MGANVEFSMLAFDPENLCLTKISCYTEIEKEIRNGQRHHIDIPCLIWLYPVGKVMRRTLQFAVLAIGQGLGKHYVPGV